MQTPIQVTFRGFEHSPVIDQLIQARAAQLQTLARDKLTSCHVVVERGHERVAIVFHARIDVTLPGTVLIVNHGPHNLHHHDEPEEAVRDAFNLMQNQIKAWEQQHPSVQ